MPAYCRYLAIGLLWCGGSQAVHADDDFPYEAFVAVDGAEVVAGPGHRFYATALLPRGTPIEIYREEASGWLAIRPPDESFSWVPGEFVQRSPEDEQVGQVKEPTPAWIGTAVERINEHRQQVTLKAGELVQILGQKTIAGSEGDASTWLKIAPPSGEFRWIHLRDVSRQRPEVVNVIEEVAAEEKDSLTPTLSQRERVTEEPGRLNAVSDAISLRDLDAPAARHDSHFEQAQFQAASRGEAKPASPDGFVPRKRRAGEGVRSQESGVASRKSADRQITTHSPTHHSPLTTYPNEDAISRQLEQIETDLSLMVAQDKSLWNLASLRERAAELVERGGDAVSRGRARLVLEKIKRFEGAFEVEDYGPIVAETGGQAASGPRVAQADPRYDTEGWLKPVVSRKSDKPVAPYAVVDRDGQPLCFITPSPGLNLQRYLNKQVGVYGRRGFLEELRKPHVTAERVIDLDRQWR